MSLFGMNFGVPGLDSLGGLFGNSLTAPTASGMGLDFAPGLSGKVPGLFDHVGGWLDRNVSDPDARQDQMARPYGGMFGRGPMTWQQKFGSTLSGIGKSAAPSMPSPSPMPPIAQPQIPPQLAALLAQIMRSGGTPSGLPNQLPGGFRGPSSY